jgi:hypothetical protein
MPSQRAFEGAHSDGEIQAAIVGGIRPVLHLVPELVEGINVRKIIANCWKQGTAVLSCHSLQTLALLIAKIFVFMMINTYLELSDWYSALRADSIDTHFLSK